MRPALLGVEGAEMNKASFLVCRGTQTHVQGHNWPQRGEWIGYEDPEKAWRRQVVKGLVELTAAVKRRGRRGRSRSNGQDLAAGWWGS